MTTSWRLPALGSVRSLVAAYSDAGHMVAVDEVDRDVFWVSGSGLGRKQIRLNRKLLHILRCTCLILVLRYGRGCVMLFYIGFLILITGGGGVSRIMMVLFLLMKGLGWVDSLGMRPLPQGCMFLMSR